MLFPDSDRVVYAKNTLRSVICQLRFPAILRIETHPPVDFQDRIRVQYPLFEEKHSPELPAGVPPEFAKIVVAEMPFAGSKSFEFGTRDERWRLSLTKGFLALTTLKYRRWEEFKELFAEPQAALKDVYQPAFYSRIGLRYRNEIRRSELGVSNHPWRELLREPVIGELACESLASSVGGISSEVLFDMDSGHKARVRHGLIPKSSEDDEPCYYIDADFFTEGKTEITDASQILDRFNRESGRFFRWCIQDRLHRAMEPTSIE